VSNHIDPTGQCIEDLCIGEIALLATALESTGLIEAGAEVVGGIVTAARATALGATVVRGGAAMVQKGEDGVQVAKEFLESKGLITSGKEITTKTETGKTRFDLGMKDGESNIGVEVKNGPTAKLNRNQVDQHGKINSGGANTMTGGNAEKAIDPAA
jgi:hypothetical protein